MQKITENELLKITGGGYSIGFIIGAIVVVISGIIDGFSRPLECRFEAKQ